MIGDTMNTAARIQQACRETDNRVLASVVLLDRLAALPPGVTQRRLGALEMRGKERALEIHVLEAGGWDQSLPRSSLRSAGSDHFGRH